MKSKLQNLLKLSNVDTNLLYVQLQNRFLFLYRSSAFKHKQFVNDSLRVTIVDLPISEVEQKPTFINALHVAVQSSGKLRLMLVLSFFTSFFMKKSCKYEDLKLALQFFEKGNCVFTFDKVRRITTLNYRKILDNTFLPVGNLVTLPNVFNLML